MGRLIDDEELTVCLVSEFLSGEKSLGQAINDVPTAFDLDGCAEEIKRIMNLEMGKAKAGGINCGYQSAQYGAYFKALEIMRKAGAKI